QPSGKGSKLLRYVEHRLRVTLHDGRSIIGTFLAFDKHLNLVLSEAEEFRVLRKSRAALLEERTERRSLGLVLIRGENVVSLAVEGPPPPSGKSAAGIAVAGRGRGNTSVSSGGPPPPGGVPMGLGAAPMHGVGAPGMPPPPPPGAGVGMGRGRGRR
ncbi:Sm-like ribonucleo protein, partial [Fragilariopsis cylindrus CCMP1102]